MSQLVEIVHFDGAELHLLRSDNDVRVFAQLVEPQPNNLPPGLVLITLPRNCYIDPKEPIT